MTMPIMFVATLLVGGADDLVAAVNRGKTCKLASFDKDQLNCTYVISDDLVIEIAGVGDPKAAIAFPKSLEHKESRHTATVGLADGCIRVKRHGPNDSAIAFISPKDGKVYRAPGPWCSWFAALKR